MEEELDPRQLGVTVELFREWHTPRFGTANPQKIKSNVWEWLVRSKLSAYTARQKIGDPSSLLEAPTWSFDRFGQSITQLANGRTIYIGGEHEDFYDSDFYIYNDVVVVQTDGTIDFYCYRKSDFPPTDFHTATLVDETIIILGSLGYRGERNWNHTPIYLLRLDNFEIHNVKGAGLSPGWIHGHTATLSEDKKSIIVTKGQVEIQPGDFLRENIEDWKLHLDDWSWERLTNRKWAQFAIRRKDRKMIPFWDIRHALWSLEQNMDDFYQDDMERLEKFIDYRPDVKLVDGLYSFGNAQERLHKDEDRYNVFWTYMDDIRIRFTEEMHGLKVVIEGGLAPDKVSLVKDQLIEKLSALVNSPCELEEH